MSLLFTEEILTKATCAIKVEPHEEIHSVYEDFDGIRVSMTFIVRGKNILILSTNKERIKCERYY
jgi:hypothetical protein